MQYLKKEIREKILQSALKEFEENGFAGATMRQIALGADISTSNIYRYFPGKDEIFAEIMRMVHQQVSALIKDLQNLRESQPDIKTTAHIIARGILKIYNEYGRELLVITDKSKGSKYDGFKETLVEMVSNRLRGNLAKDADESDKAFTLAIATGFIESIFWLIRNYHGQEKIKELINRLVYYYFDELGEKLNKEKTA
ncbi:MAG: TetR/AcrR family transcriptional regulator [Firmicutes bacterium]|nr:TetR/AcrR family transcriptional regulator [Bacillota bacterium]